MAGMQNSAFLDELNTILPAVSRPARYTGGEWNARNKPWEAASIRLALAYPDIYDVGMSNLGLHILYEIANAIPDVLCDRAYAPWPDMEAAMRQRRLPLYGLESRRPLADFDLIGFSLPYELNLTNVLNMLDLAGLPVLAGDRRAGHPFIIAGGSGAYNAEPAADFLDLVVLGDGEEALVELLDVYRDWRCTTDSRSDFLVAAARIAGVYVPSFYRADYDARGGFLGTAPIHPAAPARVRRRLVEPLPPAPVRPVVPYIETVHDRAVIEIQRGCTQGCRFCQAGILYRPLRERSASEIVQTADALLNNTGYTELGLLSLSSADHSQIETIVRRLNEHFRERPISLSLPSLRVDSFSVSLAKRIQERRRSGLTFAPEAGSQRLRDVINKKVTDDDLLRAAEAAFSNGWQRIKLYFMIGLPTETADDVLAIGDLVRRVLAVGRSAIGRRALVSLSVSTFVPKAHTPFQWMPLMETPELEAHIAILQGALRGKSIHMSWRAPVTTELEAAIGRGDRRLAGVIQRAWQLGARLDAWDEHFRPAAWQRAFAEAHLSPDMYARRPGRLDDPLPWDHLDAGVTKAFLWAEAQRAVAGETLSDCRDSCHACGIRQAFPSASCPALADSDSEDA